MMRVSNPNSSPFGIHGCDAAPTPTRRAELVSYYLPVFTAFIPSASAAQFPKARQYEAKTMSVSGKITLYKGKPEIIVNAPSQISAK
jgi:hypothetical protein